MKVACLQFAPRLGAVASNIKAANALLAERDLTGVDLLVLPELALSGYNFPSLSSIKPFLEATAAGPSARWAAETASRLKCLVTIGYPETTSRPDVIPETVYAQQASGSSSPLPSSALKHFNYNSTVTISSTSKVLAHYRKTHLYYTDERWALESPTRWLTKGLPLELARDSTSTTRKTETSTTFAICMDLNPWAFIAPSSLYEFANHAVKSSAKLAICNMAWLSLLKPADSLARPADLKTNSDADSDDATSADASWLAPDSDDESDDLSARSTSDKPIPTPSGTKSGEDAEESAANPPPDISTLYHWIERLTPLISAPELRIVVIANRCGVEDPFVDLPIPRSQLADATPQDAAVVVHNDTSIAFVEEPKTEAPDMTADSVALVEAVLDADEAPGEPEEQCESVFGYQPPVGAVKYAGTTCVIQMGNGKVDLLGVMGREEEGVLIADC